MLSISWWDRVWEGSQSLQHPSPGSGYSQTPPLTSNVTWNKTLFLHMENELSLPHRGVGRRGWPSSTQLDVCT